MRKNWNTTPADIRYYTHFQAGPVATCKTATELEDEIIAVAGYERGAAIVRQCWAGCAVIHVVKAKLQAALDDQKANIRAAALYIAQCGGYIAGPTQVHTGRGTYGFFGPGKFARAAEVKRYLDNNGVAYTVQPHRWNEVTISI